MRAAAVFALLLLAPHAAEAHAFAQRYDLPLPLWHYLAGAGAAVALSFIVAGLTLRGDKAWPEKRIALPPTFARGVEIILRALSIFAFLLLMAAGLIGEQGDWDSNLLVVGIWVIWWVGIAFASAALGDLWELLDPWRNIARLFAFRAAPCAWPAKLGAWPAVVLFFAFAWCELAWTENAMPRKLATLVLFYSALTWIGMALFGIETWRRKADPFARVFGLFARFSAVTIQRGTFVLRPFGAALRQDATPSRSASAFIILMLATVAFDGIAETPLWESLVGEAMRLLYAAGVIQLIGYTSAGSLVKTLGLIATPLIFAAAYVFVCAIVGRIAGESASVTARRYVLTLVPIAIAYHLAHYLSYLVIQGQAVIPLLSDPLNLGWNLFGTAGREIDIAAIDMEFVWLFAVAAIVLGHVAAIALAHREALNSLPPHRALAAQAPMALFMVAYTMLSLWILSQPIVEI